MHCLLDLGCTPSSLALILVMQGADESSRKVPLQLRHLPLKLNSGLVANLAMLALVGLLWLPLLPSYSTDHAAGNSYSSP